MKVTTVRFGSDLWAFLEDEAVRAGVSVSQYLREAGLARATAAATARGESPFELLGQAANPVPAASAGDRVSEAHRVAEETRDASQAVRAESEQARRMSNKKRAQRRATRGRATK